jgi:hypothetical protein
MITSTKGRERNKMNAINAVKAELKNSNDIEKTSDGFVVWDEYGMIIGNFDNIDAAVDALFNHSYGA